MQTLVFFIKNWPWSISWVIVQIIQKIWSLIDTSKKSYTLPILLFTIVRSKFHSEHLVGVIYVYLAMRTMNIRKKWQIQIVLQVNTFRSYCNIKCLQFRPFKKSFEVQTALFLYLDRKSLSEHLIKQPVIMIQDIQIYVFCPSVHMELAEEL